MTGLIKHGHGFRTLRSEMDRLFDNWVGMMPARAEGSDSTVWAPSVDISEDTDNYYVRAELPGMAKDDIDLEVENNQLSIRGERRFEKQADSESYHFVERSYGSFYRSFTLPRNVDSNGIAADYRDGLLSVTIPKKEEVKPKRVEIRL